MVYGYIFMGVCNILYLYDLITCVRIAYNYDGFLYIFTSVVIVQ